MKWTFIMATQNEDLAILKLLVKHARSKRNQVENVELCQMNQSDWKHCLFGQDNIFLPKIMAKENDVSIYIKKVYKEEYSQEYPDLSTDTSTTDNQITDALENAKSLFELQSQQGDPNLSMYLNTSLNLSKNIDLLILNKKNHFENFENIKDINLNDIYKVLEKVSNFKNCNDKLIKFLRTTDLRASNIKPEDVNVRLNDPDRSYPLILAAKEGSSELVKALLSKGADIEAKDLKKKTALHKAARFGHEQVTRLLIEHRVEVDAKNYADRTPLHIASFYGNERIVEILLQNHANPNARNCDQETPLHRAAMWGKSKVIEVLLNYGADKELKDYDNRTPLEVAQDWKLGNYKAAIALLEDQK